MSGAGRKSYYRRRVMNDYLGDCPELQDGQSVVEAERSRGGNIIEVILPGKSEVELALLPTRFKKVLWVKRGNYLIVSSVSQRDGEMGNVKGVRHRVEHVLSKDQVKQLKQRGLFPTELNKDISPDSSQQQQGGDIQAAAVVNIHEELDNDFVNPNRRVPVVYCSEDESEEEEEEEYSSEDDSKEEVFSVDEENEE